MSPAVALAALWGAWALWHVGEPVCPPGCDAAPVGQAAPDPPERNADRQQRVHDQGDNDSCRPAAL